MKPELFVLLFLGTCGIASASDKLEPILDESQLEDLHEEDLDLNDELFDRHVIRKREVSNDDAFEGSGDDTPTTAEPPKPEPQNTTTIHNEPAVVLNTTLPVIKATPVPVAMTTIEPVVPETIVAVASTNKSLLEPQSTVAGEIKVTIASTSLDNTTVSTKTPAEGGRTTADNKFAVHEVYVHEPSKESEVKPVETDKQHDGVEKENAPEIQTSHHKEDIDQKQSGVAVLTANSDTATLEGSERTLGRMKPNETLKSAVVDEPVPGESRPESAKSDTKIIIYLLAGVVAVGVVAATFNYVRKKRQSENNAVDGTNGGRAKIEDPEDGREMKPLMKNGEGEIRPTVAVEYEDEKAEGK